MTTYNRENPSSRYRELLGYYRQMHVHGDPEQNVPPAKMFDGKSLPQHAGVIRALISETNAKTILDYGSGKGHYYSTEIESGDGTHYTKFDQLSLEGLKKIALILHDIYGSFDIVLRALMTFDSKAKSSLAEKYLKYLS
jgi:hypothetical protein